MGNFLLPLLPETFKTQIAPFANILKRRFKISKMAGSDFRATMTPFSDAFFASGGEVRGSSMSLATSATI